MLCFETFLNVNGDGKKKAIQNVLFFQKAINSQIAVSLRDVSPFLPACGSVCVSPYLSSFSSSLCLFTSG